MSVVGDGDELKGSGMLGHTLVIRNDRAKVRYGFSLSRVSDPDTLDERYDLLGVIEVNADPRSPEGLNDGLRPWALATLAAGNYRFGRYHASYDTLDEDGEPDKLVVQEFIDWSGEAVLVPQP
jgi:hypothetical protein